MESGPSPGCRRLAPMPTRAVSGRRTVRERGRFRMGSPEARPRRTDPADRGCSCRRPPRFRAAGRGLPVTAKDAKDTGPNSGSVRERDRTGRYRPRPDDRARPPAPRPRSRDRSARSGCRGQPPPLFGRINSGSASPAPARAATPACGSPGGGHGPSALVQGRFRPWPCPCRQNRSRAGQPSAPAR